MADSSDDSDAPASEPTPTPERVTDAPSDAASDAPSAGSGSAVSRARRVAGRNRATGATATGSGTSTGSSSAAKPKPGPGESDASLADGADEREHGTPVATASRTTPAQAAAARRQAASGKSRPRGRGAQPGVTWEPDATEAASSDATEATPSEATPSDAKPSKAGRNLPAAIGVGAGLGGLIIATLFIWRPAFAIVAGVAVLYGVYELSRAMAAAAIRITLLPLLVGGAAMLVAAWERGPSGLVLGALITVLGSVVWRLGDGVHGYARDVSASSFVVLYLPLLAGFAVLLAHPHDGAARVLAFVATVVCSDTGGYATGVLFGKHPLAPIVSKGKTWEGFAGSVIACSAAGILFMVFTFHHEWWKGLLFGLAIVVTATLGDLGESMIKRDLGIKDMGSLLPGHGGVMDRLDSLLPCAAVAYLILSGFAPV